MKAVKIVIKIFTIFIILWLGTEFVFYQLIANRERNTEKEFPRVIMEGEGSTLIPNSTYSRIFEDINQQGELIREVSVYTSDQYARRISFPLNNSDNILGENYRSKHILFFGCSFTYGDGVSDNETISYLVNELNQDYYAYNYAKSGYGTANMLYDISNDTFSEQVPQKEGYMIYIFIDDHIRRIIGDLSIFRIGTWSEKLPYYYLNEAEEPIYGEGSMSDKHPYATIYKLLNQSNVVDYYSLNYPPASEKDILLAYKLIEASKNRYEEMFKGKFIVLFHPIDSGPNADKLKPYLQQAGIEYIDNTVFNYIDWEQYHDRYVGKYSAHPTGETNKEIANFIVNYLGIRREDNSSEIPSELESPNTPD